MTAIRWMARGSEGGPGTWSVRWGLEAVRFGKQLRVSTRSAAKELLKMFGGFMGKLHPPREKAPP